MKITYTKPALYAESFVLAEHIAGNCGYKTNHYDCSFYDDPDGTGPQKGTQYFNTTHSCADADLLWDGIADPATATYADLAKLNVTCYNAPVNFQILITS